ncbi:MAG: ABC transporter, partial [Propionibacterium sp.]|nr:ABC transporter [Propionibacterium sp.]
GALRQLDDDAARLRAGLDEQHEAADDLRAQTGAAFASAAERVGVIVGDGSMLRGEIIAHWHDVVGTTNLMRGLDEKVASIRARARRWWGAEPKAEKLQEAVSDQLARVLVDEAESAVDAAATAWTRTGWGRALLTDDLRQLSPDFGARAAATVRGWQQEVLGLVTEQGRGKRLRARLLALGTNAIGATLMVVIFASTGGLTGAEAGVAGGTSLLAQRLLESVFGAGAVERLTKESRALLDARVRALLDEEGARFTGHVDAIAVERDLGERLAEAALRVREARNEL